MMITGKLKQCSQSVLCLSTFFLALSLTSKRLAPAFLFYSSVLLWLLFLIICSILHPFSFLISSEILFFSPPQLLILMVMYYLLIVAVTEKIAVSFPKSTGMTYFLGTSFSSSLSPNVSLVLPVGLLLSIVVILFQQPRLCILVAERSCRERLS